MIDAKNWDERSKYLPFLLRALDQSPNITSVFLGYEDGDFLLVRHLPKTAKQLTHFAPPKGTEYIAQSIDREGDVTKGVYAYLGANYSLIEQRDRSDYGAYDPRQRPWFLEAQKTSKQIITSPYVFFTTKEVGATIARRTIANGAVVATDITLQTLANTMSNFQITPNTEVALISNDGDIVAHPDQSKVLLYSEKLKKLAQAPVSSLENQALVDSFEDHIASNKQTHSKDRSFNDKTWRTLSSQIPVTDDASYILTLAAPVNELLADVNSMMLKSIVWLAGSLVIILPLSIFLGRLFSSPLKALVKETEAIRNFDFSSPITVSSIISEVDILARSMDGMKTTIRQFLDITTAISGEEDFDRLQDLLLDETVSASNAIAGVIYLLNNEETVLIPTGVRGEKNTEHRLSLVEMKIETLVSPVSDAIATGEISQTYIKISDIEEGTENSLEQFVKDTGHSCHVVAVPLFNRTKELVGVLTLFLPEELDTSHLSFIGALSGSAAVSIESRQLIEAQKVLFESFIQLIAGAIDAKSAYTGGHCARVPELTKMLAKACVESNEEPYQDFDLSEDDWEAVHIASWLHDCGKMTTPEYVVDKATKLETIYDRIHEIRTRFEVLKRDAEIAYWKAISQGGNEETLKNELEDKLKQLEYDYNFIATCNEGGEFLDQAKADRIKRISAYTWMRHFDDRIGISHEEKMRKDASGPAASLPVQETLLADKPEHLFERGDGDTLSKDNKWGFDVDVPENLYNKGELYNLLISRGTLTPEERYKINEHIIQTIIMLSELPYPKHLQKIPEIAGGHHEKMDGTGYPKKLKQEDMSPLARMMAIADVFEALTAVDRPYKKGKTLSESLKILSFMRNDNHIDPQLFKLFLSSGVYKQYADLYMKPDQIDEVDINDYL